MLEQQIKNERQQKDILLMTHLVLGYPSFDLNRQMIEQMVAAGVELIELQIPFSEPTSDGPVILKANDEALKHGVTVAACLDFANAMCASYPQVAFLFMTYYNIVFMYGLDRFVATAQKIGVKGCIVPDLPPEEGATYIAICRQRAVDAVFIFTPTNTLARLRQLARVSQGFVYCVGRRGVTGTKTNFDQEMSALIQRYQSVTTLPLALGFGIQSKADVDFLVGKVDIAVLGTQILRLQEQQGVAAVGTFLKGLRATA